MDPKNEEPPKKILKVDNLQCIKCQFYFRKGRNIGKKIVTKEEAKNFNETYNFFIQQNECLCENCYTDLRREKSKLQKFKRNENQSTLNTKNVKIDDKDLPPESTVSINEDKCSQFLQEKSINLSDQQKDESESKQKELLPSPTEKVCVNYIFTKLLQKIV